MAPTLPTPEVIQPVVPTGNSQVSARSLMSQSLASLFPDAQPPQPAIPEPQPQAQPQPQVQPPVHPQVETQPPAQPQAQPQSTPPDANAPASAPASAPEPEVPVEVDLSAAEPPAALKPLSRGQEIWANHRTLMDLEKPTTEGGLGFRPTGEQIREAFLDSGYHQNWLLDLRSGDPNLVRAATEFAVKQNPELVLTAIDIITQAPESSPFRGIIPGIQKQVATGLEDKYLQLAKTAEKPEHRDYWLHVLNGNHYALNGSWLTPEQLQAKLTSKPQVEDPNSLTAREQRVKTWEAQQAEVQFTNWRQTVIQDRDKVLNQAVAAAIGSIPEGKVRDTIVRTLTAAIHDEIQGNRITAEMIANATRMAQQNMGNQPVLQSIQTKLVQTYNQVAHRVLSRDAKEIVRQFQGLTPQAVQDKKVQTQLQNQIGDVAPAGAPPSNSVGGAQTVTRNKGETFEAFSRRVIGASLST